MQSEEQHRRIEEKYMNGKGEEEEMQDKNKVVKIIASRLLVDACSRSKSTAR